jgi:hypothetical protein
MGYNLVFEVMGYIGIWVGYMEFTPHGSIWGEWYIGLYTVGYMWGIWGQYNCEEYMEAEIWYMSYQEGMYRIACYI